MASYNIADFATFINQQIAVNEKIATSLWSLDALLVVVLTTSNFFELPTSTLHDYFSVVRDVISEISALQQTNLNALHEE